jgi:hypothetical protein
MLLAVPVVSAESIQLKVYGKTVKVSKWSESVVLAVNKKTAILSAKPDQAETAELDATVTVINNRVYVPLRFLSEQYGSIVSWQNNTVSILSPLSQSVSETLYNGDLHAARSQAVKLYYSKSHYQNKQLETLHESEDYSVTFLFSEGEALRFYTIQSRQNSNFPWV